MSLIDQALAWPPIQRVRRNHALEHATLQVMSAKNPRRSAAGYSDMQGFWIVGPVSTEELQGAVEEAQKRLRAGEHDLAVHPNCGTNYVAGGIFAGLLAWLAMINTGNDVRRKLERLPVVMALVTLGTILALPVGPLLQARLTVDPNLGSLEVTEISRLQRTDTPLHRVRTSQ